MSKSFVAVFLCVSLLLPVVFAQAPFSATLSSLPGSNKPQSLSTALGYLQVMPYSLWILRNPAVWGLVLSALPTFISEIPSFLAYLRFYMLQLPGSVSYMLSFITRYMPSWLKEGRDLLFYLLGNPFSTPVRVFFGWFVGGAIPNLPYTLYSLLLSLPALLSSLGALLSSLPEALVSYASPTAGALSVVLPQFVPLFFMLLSSMVDWADVFVEAMPSLIVGFIFDSILLFFRVPYDLLYTVFYLLTSAVSASLSATYNFSVNSAKLLPYLLGSLQRVPELAEGMPLLIDALPNMFAAISLFFTASVSAFLVSIPTMLLNGLNSCIMSVPLCLSSGFKFLFGGAALLFFKCPAALFCGTPAYALSAISTFLFITLPKEIFDMIRSAVRLTIALIGILLGRGFALPCIICYRCFSLPYSTCVYCANLGQSWVEPLTRYCSSRLAAMFM
jgi:hypothetical protein